MAEKSSASLGFNKPRSVLGDITNRVSKRGLSEGERCDKSIPTKPNLSKESVFLVKKKPRLDQAVGENIVDLELCGGEACSSKQKEFIPLQKEGNCVEKLVMSQSGSVDCTLFCESQESKAVELGGQAGNDCANVCGETESIKDCSCSFCNKAGYMLLDLNYQDIKARVTAIRKSQKEASILAEKSCRGSKAAGDSNELESQLMHQWRSLFEHLANQWEQECKELEATLLELSGLKERCKTEMLSAITDKH